MKRNARTKQFRKEIQEEYFSYLIEEYKKNRLNWEYEFEIQKLVSDNFEHLYDNVEMIEKLEKMGLIEWGRGYNNWIYDVPGLSMNENLQIEWIEKYPTKDWDLIEIYRHFPIIYYQINKLIKK
jgi:hypothetical protein